MADRQKAPHSGREKRISEIRILALAEVHLGETGIDAKEYRKELEEIKLRPLEIEWLEAYILVSVIARYRPSRTVGHLAKLRRRMISEGKPEAFDAFDALLRNYLHPLALTNHGYSLHSFADVDHAPVWDAVKDRCAALRALGYDAFLNSGTLLGVVRDGALIAHDDDVDLAVVLKASNAPDAAAEWETLKKTLEEHDLVQPNINTDPAICKLRSIGSTQIDLFPAWQQADKFFVYPYLNGGLGGDAVFPLKPCAVTGHPLPAQPEQMLEHNYGADWRHPDPLFKFPWDTAKTQFAPFLERLH